MYLLCKLIVLCRHFIYCTIAYQAQDRLFSYCGSTALFVKALLNTHRHTYCCYVLYQPALSLSLPVMCANITLTTAVLLLYSTVTCVAMTTTTW